jgi:AmiR/NasT family two-component response regulator
MSTSLKTIAIADDEPAQLALLGEVVTTGGYELVGTATNGLDAIQLVQRVKPNLILMDLHMPRMNGLEAAQAIIVFKSTAIVMMTGDSDPVIARQALDAGVSGYMLKPADVAQIGPILESAWHRYQTVNTLQTELALAMETLETRKVVEKAKGILMEQQGFSEELAHKFLQKMSQEQGIPLKEVCRSVIQVKMLLGRNTIRSKAV